MKTIKAFAMVLTLSLFLQACNDDNGSETVISTDEAADEISMSLTTDVTDLASDLVVISDDAKNGRNSSGKVAACGVPYDTTFTKSFTGQFISYNYAVSYGYTLSCSNGAPGSLTYIFSSDGERSTARLSSMGESEGTFTAGGFEVSKANYTLNGSFYRIHSLSQKSGAQRIFNSESEGSLTNLLVNKSTKKIEGGSATFSVTGQSSGGSTYEFTASVTFNGDGTATATINGVVYLINLTTGEVTKQP